MISTGILDHAEFVRSRAKNSNPSISGMIISNRNPTESEYRFPAAPSTAEAHLRDLGIFRIVPKPIDTATLIELVSFMPSSPRVTGGGASEPEPGATPVTQP